MENIKNYELKAKNLLKNILEVNETNANLSNKIQRGKFSFSFVLQILDVIDKDLSITKKIEK
jgi:L-cysteine desulfidase